MKFQPVIKWSGSKRSQANDIISYFPKEISTYYEPFCGGASILRALLDSDIKVHHYVASDLNKDLIDLFLAIKNTPNEVYEHYSDLWHLPQVAQFIKKCILFLIILINFGT